MKCNKKAFVTMLVSAILALALLLTGGILLSRMPHNSVVASAEGTTVTKIARSYTDDGWYYGDSAGNLVKLSEEGEKLAETVITEGQGIRSVASDPKLDGLLVLDEAYDLFWVKDKGNSLEKQFIRAFPGGYLSLAVDDDFVYFAVPASRYTRFAKYDKNDLAGEPVARGQMYTCVKQGAKYSFQPVVSGTVVGMYADEDHLFVVTGEGQYHRIAKDFSLNDFPFLSADELKDLNAEIAGDGTVTLDAGSYDAAKYRTARKQLAAKSVSYDEANARFYVASADAEFAALDKSFNEIEGYSHKLPNTPATGAMAFHRESGTVYIAYNNISSVTAIDTNAGRVLYQADVAFYITNMAVPSGGNRLLVICSGSNRDNPDYKELYSADIHTLSRKGTMNTLGILSLVFGALALAVAIFAALAAFRKGYAERCVVTLKGMARNWVTYLIILGSLAMLILFCYYPGISSMLMSFFDYTRDNPLQYNPRQ